MLERLFVRLQLRFHSIQDWVRWVSDINRKDGWSKWRNWIVISLDFFVILERFFVRLHLWFDSSQDRVRWVSDINGKDDWSKWRNWIFISLDFSLMLERLLARLQFWFHSIQDWVRWVSDINRKKWLIEMKKLNIYLTWFLCNAWAIFRAPAFRILFLPRLSAVSVWHK